MNERIKKMLAEVYEVMYEENKDEFDHMSKREILEEILNYEGITGYTDWIINLIQDIYGVSLEN